MDTTSSNFLVTPQIYASKEKRFVNMIIDFVGYYIFTFLIGIILGLIALSGIEGSLDYFSNINRVEEYTLNLLIGLVYFILLETFFQKSLGKFITKTIVVLKDGSKPGIGDIFIRSLCRYIPFDALSFLGDQGRGWHDSISETYVVDEVKFKIKKKTELELDLIGKPTEE